MKEFVLWGEKYGVPPIRITSGDREHCRQAMGSRIVEGGWKGLCVMPKGSPYHSRPEWSLPYQPRMINDRDPGHSGPVCGECAGQWSYYLSHAESYGDNPYGSPHQGTYRHEARVIQWACASGVHGVRLMTY